MTYSDHTDFEAFTFINPPKFMKFGALEKQKTKKAGYIIANESTPEASRHMLSVNLLVIAR